MEKNPRTIYTSYFKSSVGELIVGDYEGKLCLCDWRYRSKRDSVDLRILEGLGATYQEKSTPLIKNTIAQIEDYLLCKRRDFDLPILTVGSEFQKKVWNELINIPFGSTMSYLELSKKVATAETIRAVAAANGANSISIIIPCHRIIGSNGELTGYAGGLATKKKLLKIEGAIPDHGQLSIFPD